MTMNDNTSEWDAQKLESSTRHATATDRLARLRREKESLEAWFREESVRYQASGSVPPPPHPDAEAKRLRLNDCVVEISREQDALEFAAHKLREIERKRNSERDYKVSLSELKNSRGEYSEAMLAAVEAAGRETRLREQLAAAMNASDAAAARRAQVAAQGLGPDVQGAIGAVGAFKKLMKGSDDDASKHSDSIAAINMALSVAEQDAAKKKEAAIAAKVKEGEAETALAQSMCAYADLRHSEALLQYLKVLTHYLAAHDVAYHSVPRLPPIERMAKQFLEEAKQDIRDSIASVEPSEASEPKPRFKLGDLLAWMR